MVFNRVDSNEFIKYNEYQSKKSLFNLKNKFKINDYRIKNNIFSSSNKNNNDTNKLVLFFP